MRPLTVSEVRILHVPGRPSNACVRFEGGICLDGIQVWPARHGPLVLFPVGKEGNGHVGLTPLMRSLVVQAVIASWRRTRQEMSRIAA